MGRPRQIHPGRCHLLTRVCVQRTFLLRPDEEADRIYTYCLAIAAARYGIDVLLMVVMSNHHHVVLHDPEARVSEFTEHLHKLVARAMNALRGRRGYFWEAGAASLVHLATADDVFSKMVYVATNPVAAGLVERANEWPGVTGWRALCADEEIVVQRPTVFFREHGPMPEEVRLRLGIPAALGDPSRFRAALVKAVATREAELAAERRASGRVVLGAAAVRAQAWTDTPSMPPPRGALSPRIAARSTWTRIALLAAERAFQAAYRRARAAWRAGERAIFPAGTYWLRRFAGVAVEVADAMPVFIVDGPAPVPIG